MAERKAFELQRELAIKKIKARRAEDGAAPIPTKAQSVMSQILEDSTKDDLPAAKATMQRIAQMVEVMRTREERLAAAEADAKREKAALWTMATVDLPELLREAGFKELTLEDGTIVKVEDDIQCGISEERRPAAHAWLREHNLGAVIKVAVIASFGKGEEERASKLYEQLVKKLSPDAVEQKEQVHPATLKALLKEQLEAGKKVPLTLFGINPYSIAKLKTAKAKKGQL